MITKWRSESLLAVCEHPFAWKSHEVVVEAVKRGINVIVLADPSDRLLRAPDNDSVWQRWRERLPDAVILVELDKDLWEEAMSEIVAVHGTMWVIVHRLDPEVLRFAARQGCKTVFVPYSVFLDNNYKSQFPMTSISDVSVVATYRGMPKTATSHLERRLRKRFCATGYPPMATIASNAVPLSERQSGLGPPTRFIWAPHWSVDAGRYATASIALGAEVVESLVRDSETGAEVLIRQHPFLFRWAESHGGQAARQAMELIQQTVAQSDRIQFATGDYRDLFRDADAILLDSISFTAEFQLSGKPVVFINSDSSRLLKNMSSFGRSVFAKTRIVGTPNDALDALRGEGLRHNLREIRDSAVSALGSGTAHSPACELLRVMIGGSCGRVSCIQY